MAEIYRAGIESIEKGQTEAARSLGLNYLQTMRFIILPQAIKRVLPPMSNESLSMLKDSALLSAIGVTELTYWGKATIATTANTFLGWNTVAFIYLILGLMLSLVVKWVESRSSHNS
jgi:polar amino acid transport system permease protein